MRGGFLGRVRGWRYIRPLPSNPPKKQNRKQQKKKKKKRTWCEFNSPKFISKMLQPKSDEDPKYHRLLVNKEDLDFTANKSAPFKARLKSNLFGLFLTRKLNTRKREDETSGANLHRREER